jgi:hypothetical protein
MANRILVATNDTWIKTSTAMAADLGDNQKVHKPRNSVIAAKSLVEVPETSHAKLELADDPGETWYIYSPHWSPVELREKEAAVAAAATKPVVAAPLKRDAVINWSDFKDQVSEYFTVGEFLNYDRRRIPTSDAAKKRLIAIATELDKIRAAWGSAIRVTSGYRPEPINRQVGGVANSRHTFGDAVDIAPVDGRIQAFQKWLDENWFGALGYGARRGFVHLDMRNGNGWKRGSSKGARWNY